MKTNLIRLRISALIVAAGSLFSLPSPAQSQTNTFTDANWMSMGGLPGSDFQVRAIATDASGNVYVGGDFTVIGNLTANHVAKWDGTRWTPLGSGVNDSVHALAFMGNNLYAAGAFRIAGSNAVNYVAKWNGTTWTTLGSGLNGTANTLCQVGEDLYVGGSFTSAGGTDANYIAKWNTNGWSGVGPGLHGWHPSPETQVYSLATLGSNLYVGGLFESAGSTAADNIAKWDGVTWSPCRSEFIGLSYFVEALAVSPSRSNLYAAGLFTAAGTSQASYVAKWDGTAWTALGAVLNDPPHIYALATSGSDLYAGGAFTNLGATPANYIAKWDGSSWTPLGLGVGGTPYPSVSALATFGSNVYASGYFILAGGSPANNIALWDGSNWTALGAGLSAPANALVVFAGSLYAGGAFTNAGGTPANYIARWDGSQWATLGSGGGFWAPGTSSPGIAKWDGTAWSAMDSGLNGEAYVVAVSGKDLYVGGNFTIAGGKVSAYIARAYLPTLPTLSLLPSGNNVSLSWPSPDTSDFLLEQTDTLNPRPTWLANSAPITDDGTNKSITLPATNSSQFFRLRRP